MADSIHVVCPRCDAVNRIPAARPAAAGKCGKCAASLFDGHPVALDTERFRRHVKSSDIPIIADFWAGWCGPCRAMAPIFERAAGELEPKARFVKVDVDAEPALATEFRITGIPALIAFKGGREVARHAGVADLRTLRGMVEQA